MNNVLPEITIREFGKLNGIPVGQALKHAIRGQKLTIKGVAASYGVSQKMVSILCDDSALDKQLTASQFSILFRMFGKGREIRL